MGFHLTNYAILEIEGKMQHRLDEQRLRKALEMGGGELREFRDRQDYWTIGWTTANGEHHASAISKNDLTVISCVTTFTAWLGLLIGMRKVLGKSACRLGDSKGSYDVPNYCWPWLFS